MTPDERAEQIWEGWRLRHDVTGYRTIAVRNMADAIRAAEAEARERAIAECEQIAREREAAMIAFAHQIDDAPARGSMAKWIGDRIRALASQK